MLAVPALRLTADAATANAGWDAFVAKLAPPSITSCTSRVDYLTKNLTTLTIGDTLVRTRVQDRDAGVTYLGERRNDQLLNRIRRRIARLGYNMLLEIRAQVAA